MPFCDIQNIPQKGPLFGVMEKQTKKFVAAIKAESSGEDRHTRHEGTPFGGWGWVVEWEPLSPVMRASPSFCRVLTIDWQVRGLCRCLWYARDLCLCQCVIASRRFTSLPTQEAGNSFPGFIPTNKQTNKQDPRAIRGFVSNIPHPRVNKTKQQTGWEVV